MMLAAVYQWLPNFSYRDAKLLHQHSLAKYYSLIHGIFCCSISIFQHWSEPFRRRQWHPTPVLLPGKSMDRGAWWAAVHGVAKSRTRLSDFTFTFHFDAMEKEMATHSSVLAWRIPGTEEPNGLLSVGLHRVGHD